jgi:IS30 family transposase
MCHNRTEIAEVIKAPKSTVSRELRRICGLGGYLPKQAHCKALNYRNNRQAWIMPDNWELIEANLRLE